MTASSKFEFEQKKTPASNNFLDSLHPLDPQLDCLVEFNKIMRSNVTSQVKLDNLLIAKQTFFKKPASQSAIQQTYHQYAVECFEKIYDEKINTFRQAHNYKKSFLRAFDDLDGEFHRDAQKYGLEFYSTDLAKPIPKKLAAIKKEISASFVTALVNIFKNKALTTPKQIIDELKKLRKRPAYFDQAACIISFYEEHFRSVLNNADKISSTIKPLKKLKVEFAIIFKFLEPGKLDEMKKIIEKWNNIFRYAVEHQCRREIDRNKSSGTRSDKTDTIKKNHQAIFASYLKINNVSSIRKSENRKAGLQLHALLFSRKPQIEQPTEQKPAEKSNTPR